MKKILIVLSVLCLSFTAHAQLGVIAGVTSTETTIKDAYANIGEVTQYHVGLALKFNLGLIAIQPALTYNVKGASINANFSELGETGIKIENKTGFLELPVQIQVGLPLGGIRPYAFAEPFVGYAITNESKQVFTLTTIASEDTQKNNWDNVKNRLEYGIGLGAGLDLFNTIQVSVRYFWNFGQLYDNGQSNFTADSLVGLSDTLSEQKSNGIMASVAFFF